MTTEVEDPLSRLPEEPARNLLEGKNTTLHAIFSDSIFFSDKYFGLAPR